MTVLLTDVRRGGVGDGARRGLALHGGRSAAPAWWAVSVIVTAVAVLLYLFFVAEGYPSQGRVFGFAVGRDLQIVGVVLVLTGSVMGVVAGTDACGHVTVLWGI